MPLGRDVGLGQGHTVLDRDPAPPPQRGGPPNFRTMCIVAKRSPISATAEHLFETHFITLQHCKTAIRGGIRRDTNLADLAITADLSYV